ncbi:DUF305 domain-containing protein [Streptomyces roseicoloratus]|uniref:DUF305 domain-containing protein n=1 Tax=Streptomyces roseicoloratus TaxID=2508722 RepID=UPI001009E9E0|nr:DUF305 domain-containing protein [Streptomyces roseicoloratus]
MPNRRATRAAVAVLLSAAVALALGACESGPGSGGAASAPPAGSPGGSPGIVAPGRPGEPAKRVSPEEAARLMPDERPNSADFAYVQMMITHHRQALTMTALAPRRARSDKVRKVAERIQAAQAPEIGAMEGWLKTNGGARPQTGHDHHTMPGMATEAQLAQLEAAKGEAFDTLFLRLMIAHHEGAVTMAADVLSQGNNVLVEEMANDVIAQQTAEIDRMRSM